MSARPISVGMQDSGNVIYHGVLAVLAVGAALIGYGVYRAFTIDPPKKTTSKPKSAKANPAQFNPNEIADLKRRAMR